MSLIAPLLQQRGVDPNVLLAMKGNNGFGNGDGSWFIWLLFILCFCGWGGNGFGFGGRGNVCGLFFFQAEDGIRYADVTGVQTCALPILYILMF